MKAVVVVALALAAVGQLRAGWADLKPGMDDKAVVQCVCTPMLASHGRAAAAMWTYDSGGFVLFAEGRVTYWEQPKSPIVALPQTKTDLHAKAQQHPKPAAILAKS
jgi:hypothetical protein